MAIALIEKIVAQSSSLQPVPATFTLAIAAGSSIVTNIGQFDATGATVSVTDSVSNTYTRRGTATVDASYRGDIFTAHNVTGGAAITVTINKASGDSSTTWISAWSGVSTTTAPAGTSATGTSATQPTITSGTLTGESVVVAHTLVASGQVNQTITEPASPWVLIGDEDSGTDFTDNNCVYQIASSGTLTATWVVSPARAWMAHQVTLVGSGGATCALSGTITATTTEADIVTGGKTIILTLTGDTWIPS